MGAEPQASSGLIVCTGTSTSCTEGDLAAGQSLNLTADSGHLVVFGDGIETGAISLSWGQSARASLSDQTLCLMR